MNERPSLVAFIAIVGVIIIFNQIFFAQEQEKLIGWCNNADVKVTIKQITPGTLAGLEPDSTSTAYLDNQGNLLKLSVIGEKLENTDLTAFTQLQSVDFSDCNLEDINSFRFPSTLTELVLKQNIKLTRVDLKNNPNLQILNLSRCGIVNLSTSTFPPSLTSLNLRDNKKLTSVTLSDLPNLVEIDLSFCILSELKLTNLAQLESIRFQYSKFNIIQLTNLPKFTSLDVWDCDVQSIKLSALPALTDLILSDNLKIKTIDASDLSALQRINYTTDQCELTEVLFHPANIIYPGVAKISFGRDNQQRVTSIEYLDTSAKPINVTISEEGNDVTYAKKVFTYSGSETQTKTFTAEELQ